MGYYIQHIRVAHGCGEGMTKYTCEVCEATFLKKFNFERHKKDQKLVSCQSCSKIFCSLKQLLKHRTSVHPDFSCNVCCKIVKSKAELKRHDTFRSKDKTGCKICFKVFCTSLQLNVHMKTGHKTASEVLECQEIVNGNPHVTSSSISQLDKQETFECKICYSRFSRKKILAIHMKVNHFH